MAAQPIVRPPNAAIGFTQDATGANHILSGTGLRTLQDMANAINGTTKGAISMLALGNGQSWSSGPGNPNGAVAGNLGDLYTNTNGGVGATLFVKESGGPGTKSGWSSK
jgi:hypothetical protein